MNEALGLFWLLLPPVCMFVVFFTARTSAAISSNEGLRMLAVAFCFFCLSEAAPLILSYTMVFLNTLVPEFLRNPGAFQFVKSVFLIVGTVFAVRAIGSIEVNSRAS